jgi:hypothetical protein
MASLLALPGGDRILPAIHSDNYIALMPGASRTIRTEVEDAGTRGEKPAMANRVDRAGCTYKILNTTPPFCAPPLSVVPNS